MIFSTVLSGCAYLAVIFSYTDFWSVFSLTWFLKDVKHLLVIGIESWHNDKDEMGL